jgi:hypothetical protein
VERDGRSRREEQPFRFPGRQVRIHTIEGNPADYKNMLDYFSREFAGMLCWVDDDTRLYLEITGGTPAMTSMMVVAGVEVFGRRTHTLYVERGIERPYRVGIGRRFFSRRAQATLRTQLELHAYAVAQEMVRQERDLIARDVERQRLILALIEYADRRLSFDFERAKTALHHAHEYATGDVQARIQYRQRELAEQASETLIAELVHSTRIKYRLGDYADFTQRLFRFQEAVFRYLAEQMGMEYADPADNEYISISWIEGLPALKTFLADYDLGSGRRGVDLKRSLNRMSLGAIVDYFVQHVPDWTVLKTIVPEIHRLSRVARLLNKGLAGHGFEGIGRQDLAVAFGDEADRIISVVEDIYTTVFEAPLDASPYDRVNDLILELLHD